MFLNKFASTFAVFYTTSTVGVSFFFVIIFELVYQWGYQDTNIASGQNANDKVKDDSLIADFFGVRDVHIDVELFHQILPLFGSVLEKVVVADVADQDEEVHVFEVDLYGVDPVLVVLEAEDDVGWVRKLYLWGRESWL